MAVPAVTTERPSFLAPLETYAEKRAAVKVLEEQLRQAKEEREAAHQAALKAWPQGMPEVSTATARLVLRPKVYPKYLAPVADEDEDEAGLTDAQKARRVATKKAAFIATLKNEERYSEYRDLIRDDLDLASVNRLVEECNESGEWGILGEILGASEVWEIRVYARR